MTTATMPTKQNTPTSQLTLAKREIASAQWSKSFAAALTVNIPIKHVQRCAASCIERDPKLLKCTPESMLLAIVTGCELGVPADGRLAYIVPYGQTATYMLDYKGLVQIAYRHERVKDIDAEVVYSNEHCVYDKTAERPIIHKPLPPSKRGDPIAAYMLVYYGDHPRPHHHWMWLEELLAVRDKYSKSYANAEKNKKNDSMWHTDEEAAYKKTVLRQGFKLVPMGNTMARAIADEHVAPQSLMQGNDISDPEFATPAQLPEPGPAIESPDLEQLRKLIRSRWQESDKECDLVVRGNPVDNLEWLGECQDAVYMQEVADALETIKAKPKPKQQSSQKPGGNGNMPDSLLPEIGRAHV